ncbi:unnamed protein product [Ceutorhynchus assimilis]|uniref:Peptidase S1 domain-containing protein n=1 Tax=Ceutorhynchus assimilis TaxID=467358 RepID=A0A9N9MH38_9CUCU|nr:unnamed protein product [Ceutorhynchus assimilis]
MRLQYLLILFAVAESKQALIKDQVGFYNVNDTIKIVGGEPTDILNFPYQVSLQYYYRHICGGSIISQRWIVSAAHCTQISWLSNTAPLAGFTVRVGSSFVQSEGRVLAVSNIVEHPVYGNSAASAYDYDISLIMVSSPISYSPSIQPIPLPPINQKPIPGASCLITGWGDLLEGGSSPARLHVVDVPWISNESCTEYYGAPVITYNMMCAGSPEGGRDACQGDSGGPLAVDGVLMGVVSWGAGCARPNRPGVYAYLPAVRQWINETTGL